MDIVDHAHFEEQQRAYYQGMIDPPEHLPGFIWEIHRKGKKAKALAFGTGGGELVWGHLLLRMK